MKNIFQLIEPKTKYALPLLFDSPHSGRLLPEDIGAACPNEQLLRCADHYVDELFTAAPNHGAHLLKAEFSRNYIDVNRSIDDIDLHLLNQKWPEELYGAALPTDRSDAGIGLIPRLIEPGVPIYNRALPPEEIMQRIETHYRPYHAALAETLEKLFYNHGQVWHINCHSMPSKSATPRNQGKFRGYTKRPADFVLGDRDGSTCDSCFTRRLKRYIESLGYYVTINDPYKGVELVRRHGHPVQNRHSLQIEINKSLYMNEKTEEKSKNFDNLKNDIERIIDFIAAHITEQQLPMAAD